MPLSWVPTLLAVGFVLFGVFFAYRGGQTLAAGRRRNRSWTRLPGRVVASRRDDDNQVHCQVAVQLSDRKVLFWNRFSSTMLSDPVGREVQVLVNPADPHDAVVASGLVGGGLVGAVFVAVGAVFAVVGAGIGVVLLVR